MKFAKSGISFGLTGWTFLPLIRRSEASPEAETMSYCEPPWRISVTISSDEPAYLLVTLQPVCCSNGFTHCGCVSPSHATRLSLPAPVPIELGRFDAVVVPLLLDLLLPPQPA